MKPAPGPGWRLLHGTEDLRAQARAFSDDLLLAAAHEHARLRCSRSYRGPYALVAWCDGPVGVDIERVDPLARGFGESIATPAERRQLAGRLDADPVLVADLWSGKEALAKALGDALDYDPRRLEAPLAWRDGAAGAWRAARLPVPGGYVGWLCWCVERD